MFVSRTAVLSLISSYLPQVWGTVWYIFSAYEHVFEQPATHACRRSCQSFTKTAVGDVLNILQSMFTTEKKNLIPVVTLILPPKK